MNVFYEKKYVVVRDESGKLLSADFVESGNVETNNQQEGFDILPESVINELSNMQNENENE
jgi:hypothetical protein